MQNKIVGLILLMVGLTYGQDLPTIAVYGIKGRYSQDEESEKFNIALEKYLLKSKKYNVIDRTSINAILDESGLSQKGFLEAPSKFSGLINIDYLITGQAPFVKMIDVRNGLITGAASFDFPVEEYRSNSQDAWKNEIDKTAQLVINQLTGIDNSNNSIIYTNNNLLSRIEKIEKARERDMASSILTDFTLAGAIFVLFMLGF